MRGQKNKTEIWIGTTIVLVYAVNLKSITTRKKSGLRPKTAGVNIYFNRDFGVITHYEFGYVKTEWAESDHEDSDSRDHHIQLCEAMRVNGPCEELGDFEPEEERLAIMRHNEVGLKLWYFYYQNTEVKKSSLYFSNKDAFEARRKLKPLIKSWKYFSASFSLETSPKEYAI